MDQKMHQFLVEQLRWSKIINKRIKKIKVL
jgi:hypothetical protein